MKHEVKHPQPITNAHCHFRIGIPKGFPSPVLGAIGQNKVGQKVLGGILRNAIPWTDEDALDKLWLLMQANEIKTMAEMYDKIKFDGDYSERTRFFVLTVNMAHMGAGRVPFSFGSICRELEYLRRDFPKQIIPFFHADCRSGNMYELLNEFVIDGEWGGVKAYSSMGVKPQDERNHEMYRSLVRVNKPIIAHCTYSNPVHYKGKTKHLKELLGDWYDPKASRKENCDKFTNPMNWMEVARQYPELRICLAHAGGQDAWKAWKKNTRDPFNLLNVILGVMKECPNVWMDVSFTINDKECWSVLKYLMTRPEYAYIRNRVMWGTDWYMNISEVKESVLNMDFEGYIGIDIFNHIARTNPAKFIER